jgi:hypothetical protein
MSRYDIPNWVREGRGLDGDLLACMEYNGGDLDNLTAWDIQEVLAVSEGENDEEDWVWLILLDRLSPHVQNKKRYMLIVGGCDYTGWDCQSWASYDTAQTVPALLAAFLKSSYTTGDIVVQKHAELRSQWKDRHKKTTPREEVDQRMDALKKGAGFKEVTDRHDIVNEL